MDHLVFLAQERLQSTKISLNSAASGFGTRISSVKSGLSESWQSSTLQSSWQSMKARAPFINMSQRIIILKEKFNDSLGDYKPSLVYDRCLVFFLHEFSRTHIYLCCACFITGGIIGLMIGSKMRQSIAAPLKMRAVVANNYSGIEGITVVEELDAPQLYARNQLLIQVKAAGIDPVDLLISRGYGKTNRRHLNRYNPNFPTEFPIVLGRDCAGVVVAVGADVMDIHAGDQVYLSVPLHSQGTLSEYVVVASNLVALKPANLSMEGAAALPFPLMRGWGVLEQAGITSEEGARNKRFLIHGGVSSVGVILVQIIKAWGGDVTVTVFSDTHSQLATLLGANDVICAAEEELHKMLGLREKFDVILNTSGPGLHNPSLPLLLPEGVAVTAVYPRLPSDSYGVMLGALYSLFNRLTFYVTKSRWCRGERCASLPVVSGCILNQFNSLITNNQLQPIIDKAYNCQDAEVAFSHLDKVQQVGRTVVRFSPAIPSRYLDDLCDLNGPGL